MNASIHGKSQALAAHESHSVGSDREGGTSLPDDPSASGNLDKIRDILFGAQAREQERRFAQLEQHLLREATDLRNDLKRRFESLEGYIKKEVDALADRLTNEQAARGASVTKLTDDLLRLTTALEDKSHQLEKQANHVQSHVLQQLTDRTNELAADVRARQAEAASALDRAIQDLRTEKTDRAALATILLEASQRLSNNDAHRVRS
ncbi:MAG: hypothetical protein AB7P24_19290 [Nitrospira sp.]